MSSNEKLVKPYIAEQFPAYYREENPLFVEFVKEYYEWLQQEDQAVGRAKRLSEYRDIDETLDEFIGNFKDKYLPLFRFDTKTDKRTIVKHVLDLYRAKGTDRGIDLFFKLVYGTPAETYYPATDLFRLSDNTWLKRNYLEINHTPINDQFPGKKVIGKDSGATAFVEKYVIRKLENDYAYLLYVSDIVGNFKTGEQIYYAGSTQEIIPVVVGSLTTLDVTSGGEQFAVGDIVDVVSPRGSGAKARVASVVNSTGSVEFKLINGGWGFSNSANVFVSEKLLGLDYVTVDTNINNSNSQYYSASPFFLLERIYQPLANLEYNIDQAVQTLTLARPGADDFTISETVYQTNSTSNTAVGTLTALTTINSTVSTATIMVQNGASFYATSSEYLQLIGDSSAANTDVLTITQVPTSANIVSLEDLVAYDDSDVEIARVKVLTNTKVSDTEGEAFVYLTSGDATLNTYFWNATNTYSINVTTYTDKTAYGNVIGTSANLTMYVSNSTTRFVGNNILYQQDANNRVTATATISSVDYAGTGAIMKMTDSVGVFSIGSNVYYRYSNGVNSGDTAYLDRVTSLIGVANIHNQFTTIGNSGVFTVTSNSTANLTYLSRGTFAKFNIADYFSYPETVSVYTDLLRANNVSNVPYLTLQINAAAYGFPDDVAANSSSVIGDTLHLMNAVIGTITSLTKINPGKNYDAAPFIYVVDPYIAGFNKRDYVLYVNLVDTGFAVGELITQDNGAEGIVKNVINTSVIEVKRTSLLTDFDKNYTNSVIIGASTNSTAYLTDVLIDYRELPVGENSIITANVQTTDGIVTGLEVIDSGVSYKDDETITFLSADKLRAGTAKVNLIHEGRAAGLFLNKQSYLSEDKYLFDGDYYQEYSYDIRSPIFRNKFEDNYKQTMHLAGTKMFSTFVHVSNNPTELDVSLPEGTANTIG